MPATVGVVICARMGSRRLPGKVLLPAPDGRPLLAVMLDRVTAVPRRWQIVVGTTDAAEDEAIEAVAVAARVDCYRYTARRDRQRAGVNDVLGMIAGAARDYGWQYVIRLTADCPLVDPVVVASSAEDLRDWASRPLGPLYVETDPSWPEGMDVQAFTADLLHEAHWAARLGAEREHVVLWMKRQPWVYQAQYPCSVPGFWGAIRVTVDEPEDYEVVCNVLRELGPGCTTAEIINLYQRRPELFAANAHIRRNAGWQDQVAAEAAP